MACLKEETMTKWISDNDWTWQEYNLGVWNVGEQALQQMLGPKVVEWLRSGVCRSVNMLYIKNANQMNISAHQIKID